VFPHSHAYFNELAGGPLNGHKHLLSSNIDWGQDILLLADWSLQHPDKPIDAMAYTLNWLIDQDVLELPNKEPPYGNTNESALTDEQQREVGPQAGRYAVFVSARHTPDGRFDYFMDFEPVEVLGYTVYIYEISNADVVEFWRRRNNAFKPLRTVIDDAI
jgi:hypothetical protein